MTTQNIHHPKDGTATEASGERSGNANWAKAAPDSRERGANTAWDSYPEGPYFLLTLAPREGAAGLEHATKSLQVSSDDLGYSSTSCRHTQLCQLELAPGCIYRMCSTCLGSLNCSVILPCRILILLKPQKSISQNFIRTHHKVTLKAEFINREHRSLTDFVLALNPHLLILH